MFVRRRLTSINQEHPDQWAKISMRAYKFCRTPDFRDNWGRQEFGDWK